MRRHLTFLRNAPIDIRFLSLLLVLFLFKGIIIALVFEPFSGHDEVAHYSYLKVLAEEGRVPIIPDLMEWRAQGTATSNNSSMDRMPADLYKYAEQGGGDTNYTTKDWYGGLESPVWAISFANRMYPSGWIYTANHPPLYYLTMVPVFKLVDHLDVDEQVYFFRLAAIPFGMATVALSYLTTRVIFPRDKFLLMTVPAFVAFQPQISYEASMLNNDIVVIMFSSAVVWMLAAGLRHRFPLWCCSLLGLFFGLAMLSKSTAILLVLLIGFAIFIGLGPKHIKEWLPKGALVGILAGFIALPWLLYMMSTYGDPTALNRVKDLQSWWNTVGSEGRSIQSMVTDKWFHWNRWMETWGDFGWRRIRLDFGNHSFILHFIFFSVLFCVVGLAAYALKFLRTQREIIRREEAGQASGEIRLHMDETQSIMPWQVTGLITMGIACVIGYYSILQFGTTFALTQARYYFPMIVPGAILLMLGLRSWFPHKSLPYVGALLFAGLVVMNVFIYSAYVIPFWEGNGV